jgi:hypothetical protein
MVTGLWGTLIQTIAEMDSRIRRGNIKQKERKREREQGNRTMGICAYLRNAG